jgi:signal transduction histidine kinase
MIIASKTAHETDRLAALNRYAVLDTPAEPSFDDLTRLAAHICGTPMALISLLDEHRQWFKSRVGLEVTETPREIAFCSHAIQQDRIMVVPDASCDERFHDNPLVTGSPEIRFYAGVPLITADAQPLGTLCVLDRQARGLSPAQSEALQALARQVMSQLELRRHIAALNDAMTQVRATQAQLVAASRQAGMAEVATGVLHNVGNVLNSVNVSATLVAEKLKKSRCGSLVKVVTMLQEHEADLGAFLTQNPQGRQVPAYLHTLAAHLGNEQSALLKEVQSLQKNIGHVKDVVAMQQNYAKVSAVTEPVPVNELLHDALNLNAASLNCDDIRVAQEFAATPTIEVDKHKVLQILVNLVRNASHACADSGRPDKQLTLRVTNGSGRVRISVADNGVGIPPENLNRVFNHGFTTRKNGHGFGLHSGANAAREMGGELSAHSDGPGRGATFTLELPVQSPRKVGH